MKLLIRTLVFQDITFSWFLAHLLASSSCPPPPPPQVGFVGGTSWELVSCKISSPTPDLPNSSLHFNKNSSPYRPYHQKGLGCHQCLRSTGLGLPLPFPSLSTPGFVNPSSTDIWTWAILCCGELTSTRWDVRQFPWQSPLSVSTTRHFCGHGQMSPGGQNRNPHPNEEPLFCIHSLNDLMCLEDLNTICTLTCSAHVQAGLPGSSKHTDSISGSLSLPRWL